MAQPSDVTVSLDKNTIQALERFSVAVENLAWLVAEDLQPVIAALEELRQHMEKDE
jgi:hypothetical protein